MPRAFDQSERSDIRRRLQGAARRLFAAQGLLKTTVDDLAGAAGIAKGSFYSFYANKELLFFELLEQSQNTIRKPLLSSPGPRTVRDRKRLAKIVLGMLDAMIDDPFIRVLGQQRELEAVMRRVPEVHLQQHQEDDQVFIRTLIEKWSIRSVAPSMDEVAARLTTLVMLILQREFFGDRLFPFARDAAIESFCDCFFTEP